MATDSDKKSFSGVFGSSRSPEEVRRRFFEAPLDASVPSALGSVLELANVLTKLPDVFIASQNKELERVKASAGENDPRVAALQVSIEQAAELQTTAQRGQVRVQRAAMAVATGQKVFHGFVSTADLAPVAGVTVRLSERKVAGGKGTTTTDDDGYFSMALATTDWRASTKSRDLSLSQRINRLFETRKLETLDTSEEETTDAEREQQTRESTVQIFRKNQLLYEDPVPVELDGGTVYREYVINEREGSEDDYNEFVFGKAAADPDNTQTVNESSRKKSPKK